MEHKTNKKFEKCPCPQFHCIPLAMACGAVGFAIGFHSNIAISFQLLMKSIQPKECPGRSLILGLVLPVVNVTHQQFVHGKPRTRLWTVSLNFRHLK